MAMLLRVAPLLLLVALVSASNARSRAMSPAMVWSNLRCSPSSRVDYQVLSPQEMSAAVYSEFQSIREKCSDESPQIFVEFVGSEVRSSDLVIDGSTVHVLKNFVSASDHSLVLPYIASVDDGSFMANTILDSIGGESPVAVYGCPAGGDNIKMLQSFKETEEYIELRKYGEGPAHLVVCFSTSTLETFESEGELVKSYVSKLEDNGLRYAALYTSDPFGIRSLQWLSHRKLQSVTTNNQTSVNGSTNVNTSAPSGNSSSNATAPYCDDVCRTKATLLEAIFVAIVLLVILISGLCCMMGIQTPLRFEKPHDA